MLENAHETVMERSGKKRSCTVIHGHANGQERWMERIVENVHGAFSVRPRSRFKNERNTIHLII
jgi:hypothetical protein